MDVIAKKPKCIPSLTLNVQLKCVDDVKPCSYCNARSDST